MDIQTVAAFFAWCTVINGGVLLLWTAVLILAPNLVYRTQSKWFPIPRETFDVAIYGFLGLFKIVFVAFNLVPYLALRIIISG